MIAEQVAVVAIGVFLGGLGLLTVSAIISIVQESLDSEDEDDDAGGCR